jgi:hypothetical protein
VVACDPTGTIHFMAACGIFTCQAQSFILEKRGHGDFLGFKSTRFLFSRVQMGSCWERHGAAFSSLMGCHLPLVSACILEL